MKTIPLSRGMVALVDDEDYVSLSRHKWYAKYSRGRYYAARNLPSPKRGTAFMHTTLLPSNVGQDIDHINGDGLDNRKGNLRRATKAENRWNRGAGRNNHSTGCKGVRFCTSSQRWHVRIQANNRRLFLGSFSTIEAAKAAYGEAANQLHGAFAHLGERND